MGIRFTVELFQIQLIGVDEFSRFQKGIFFEFVFVNRLSAGFHLFCELVHDLHLNISFLFDVFKLSFFYYFE